MGVLALHPRTYGVCDEEILAQEPESIQEDARGINLKISLQKSSPLVSDRTAALALYRVAALILYRTAALVLDRIATLILDRIATLILYRIAALMIGWSCILPYIPP